MGLTGMMSQRVSESLVRRRADSFNCFHFQQPVFHLQPAAETRKPSIVAHDAVAGHDDRPGIAGHSLSHRPRCTWGTDRPRQLAIGAGFAAGNGTRGLPHAALELGTPSHIQRLIVEAHRLAAEVCS